MREAVLSGCSSGGREEGVRTGVEADLMVWFGADVRVWWRDALRGHGR